MISENEMEVRTADGVADAVLYRWDDGKRPGVVFLPDGIGTRPSQRQMARRVAERGYDVLLPNIYYRTSRPPFFAGKFNFDDEKTRARFAELTAPLTPEAMERDAAAYVEAVDAFGVVGFCFTGKFALRAAAAQSHRIIAAASFHGAGLYVENDPRSPHLVLPRVKARLFFGHARDDRSMPAEAIAKFEAALAAWGGAYESETYNARHGWTVPDSAAYDEREAERAFAKLVELLAAATSALPSSS
jgi:carboxymethylenebutenolidase